MSDGVGPERRYWAFLSYAHEDAGVARWLQAAIESYRIPKHLVGAPLSAGCIPPRLTPVFRDEDELAAASNLSRRIVEALMESRFLIVLCSEHSVASRWVAEEIRSFCAVRGREHILAIIVSGDRGADVARLLPPALQSSPEEETASSEVLAADLRKGRSNALLRLLAAMCETGFDAFRRRHARAQRRRAMLGGSLLAGGAIGYVALADAGYQFPGSDSIRLGIDRHALSSFRSAPSQADIQAQAAKFARAAVA